MNNIKIILETDDSNLLEILNRLATLISTSRENKSNKILITDTVFNTTVIKKDNIYNQEVIKIATKSIFECH